MYKKNIEIISDVSNHFYHDGALQFWVEQNNYDARSLYEILPNDTILYNNLSSEGNDIRGVIFRGNIKEPKISEGRFFKKDDFQNNMKLAVVGCEVETILRNNGERYILYNQEEYDVIGIIQYGMPTRLDKTVLLTSNDNNLKLSNEFIIDGAQTSDIMEFLGNEEIFGQIVAQKYNNFNILHLIDRDNNSKYLASFFVLALAINCFLMVLFWIKDKKFEIVIKKRNGFMRWQILYDLEKEMLVNLFVSSIFSIIGLYVTNYFLQYEFLPFPTIINVIFGVIFFYAFFVIILAFPGIKDGDLSEC